MLGLGDTIDRVVDDTNWIIGELHGVVRVRSQVRDVVIYPILQLTIIGGGTQVHFSPHPKAELISCSKNTIDSVIKGSIVVGRIQIVPVLGFAHEGVNLPGIDPWEVRIRCHRPHDGLKITGVGGGVGKLPAFAFGVVGANVRDHNLPHSD
ncbi:MAG: hypothetical protein CMJ20_03085 [Phycisphaeraceae bacterium]|nr:hypothetical protein [Phycisphaeraceae bacterium]